MLAVVPGAMYVVGGPCAFTVADLPARSVGARSCLRACVRQWLAPRGYGYACISAHVPAFASASVQ
eukprot:15288778-Alexandrium_andersonii.AAC.1